MTLSASFTNQAWISPSSHMMHINGLYNHVVCDFPFMLVILLQLYMTNIFTL